jgi:small conductance mechanosensitive channel
MPVFRLILLVLFSAQVVLAQEEPAAPDPEAVEQRELPAENVAEFDERLAEIAAQKKIVARLSRQFESSEGLVADIIGARMDVLWTAMFDDTVSLAQDVSALRSEGFDVDDLASDLAADLEVFPGQAADAIERLRDDLILPTGDMAASEFVVRDQQLLKSTQKVDAIFSSMHTYTSIAASLGLDEAEERAFLIESLEENAANRSIFLDLALEGVDIMRAAAVALPSDEQVLARLGAMEARVQLAAKALQSVVALMDQVGLETSEYHQHLLTATGELTTEVLDVGVMAGLISEWSVMIVDLAAAKGPQLVFRLIIIVLILFVFSRLAGLVQNLARKALNSSKVRLSALLNDMIVATVRNLIVILGILIALSQVGVSLGPLLAGLGIAGFIIGFALQDTLSNFASGMLILIYRPFDVGDFVEAGGVMGKVSHMSIVNTTFKTIDNQVLVVPNNLVWSGVITNVTAQRTRRIDLTFGVAYSDDIVKVEKILADIVSAHEAVLDDPEPMIKLHELGESSVNFVVRPWVKTEDYWDTYWDLMRTVKMRFDAEGITIPFPQHDVHVVKT